MKKFFSMKSLKQKILTGWTFIRALYFGLGIFILIQSILDQQWLFVFVGAYFAAMGFLGFGCACFYNPNKPEQARKIEAKFQKVEYEEIKENDNI